VSPGVKFKDAELLGIPTIVVIGKGLADGVIEVRDRKSGESQPIEVAAAFDAVLAQVRGGA
jgi:prolyl-tRNA synthetase